jgi:exodeoxyribonuclease V beta subunit
MPSYRYRKPEVIGRIDPERHTVIEASAGTGKTFALEHLIVDLILERDASIDEILVVTFTEKATAELKSRVRNVLSKLLALEGDSDRADDSADCWVVDDGARAKLSAALLAFDSATISTIHGFCFRVLTEHAFANKQLFEQTQIDGRTGFARAFVDVLRHDLARGDFNRSLLRAFLTQRNRSVEQLERLLYECVRGRGELRPAFDARELVAAVRAFDVAAAADAGVAAVLERSGDVTGEVRERLAAVCDRVRAAQRDGDFGGMLATFDAMEAQDEQHRRPVADLAASLAKIAGDPAVGAVHADAARLAAAVVPLTAAVVQEFRGPVARRFEQTKRQSGTFDFDDMLEVVLRSVESSHGEGLVRVLRDRYRYALIDEFQDTDDVQWGIFRTLFFDSAGGHRMYLIGDPKQAIYSFRGADVHAYLRARDEVEAAGGAVVHLDHNYRATGELIDACNAVLEQDGHPFFTGAIRYHEPVQCGKPALAAEGRDGSRAAPIHLFHLLKRDKTANASNEKVLETLALRIGREIQMLLHPERGLVFDGKPIEARDIFILTRKTREGFDIGRVLRKLGIAHAYYKQEGLFQTPEAEHIKNVLAAIDDPHDRSRRYLAWLTPLFDVPLEDLERCADVPGSHPLMRRLFEWKACADRKQYETLFSRIVEESGILRREVFFKDSERELTNYLHIVEVLLEEVSRRRCTLRELILVLRGFIDENAGRLPPGGLDRNVQRIESERQAVQIMTMHMAKGLEASVVFLAGGFTHFGRWQHDVSVYHDDDGDRVMDLQPGGARERAAREVAEEDQRMLYVALTRAKARLYLPCLLPDSKVSGVPAPPVGTGKRYAITAGKSSSYYQLNAQLRHIVEGDKRVAPGLFSREVVLVPESLPARLRVTGGTDAVWTPSPALLAEPEPAVDYETLREQRRGYIVTSYSQMRAAAAGHDSPPIEGVRDDLVEAALPELDRDPDELPPGRASGSYLHAAIEEIDLDEVAATPLSKWARSRRVTALFRGLAGRYGVEARHVPHAIRLVHRTLASPVALGTGRRIDKLAAAAVRLREMEFLFPIPEREPGVERGFVKGYVDYVFEHDGLAYFVDWKSDALESWAAADVAAYVADNYVLQAKLYAIALVKQLDLRTEVDYDARFGGLLYCFMRGMKGDGDGTAGVYFARPAWSELRGWERELVKRDAWGQRRAP